MAVAIIPAILITVAVIINPVPVVGLAVILAVGMIVAPVAFVTAVSGTVRIHRTAAQNHSPRDTDQQLCLDHDMHSALPDGAIDSQTGGMFVWCGHTTRFCHNDPSSIVNAG